MSKLHFKISTGLKSIIGKDLITDEFIAIYELVKNAFDAYATRVDILFKDDAIIIQDNGKGMSYDDLINKWLFVAYSAKTEGNEDESVPEIRDYRSNLTATRYYAGAKGIGRFSCDRLGGTLNLYTRRIHANSVERLNVNWRDFEKNAETEFKEIAVEHNAIGLNTAKEEAGIVDFKHGTILLINKLHSQWDRPKIKALRRALTKLINPFDENTSKFSDKGFKIFLHAPEFADEEKSLGDNDKITGEVKNSIIELVKFKSTSINVKITPTLITTRLEDRGVVIYEIQESNPEYKFLNNVEFSLYFLNTAAKNNFTRLMGIPATQFGSVFVFKNGFRVQPYGEPEVDKLGIDDRKQQGYNRFLGNRDLLGRIEIRGDAQSKDFKEASSRDGGFVDTEGYRQLTRAFTKLALVPLEKYVTGILWYADKEDEERQARREFDRLNSDTPTLIQDLDVKAEVADLLTNLTRGKKDAVLVHYDSRLLEVELDDATPDASELIDRLYNFAVKANDTITIKNLSSVQQYITSKQEKAKAEELLRKQEESARRQAEKEAREAEERARKAEADAKSEQMANMLLKSTVASGFEEVISLHHHIGISSDTIAKLLAGLYRQTKSKAQISSSSLMEELNKISFENSKIHAVTQFATKANFVMNSEEIKQDIVRFLWDYILNISSVAFTQIDIKVENKVNGKIIRFFKPIEISIVIDNIISNSRKAKAKNVLIELNKSDDDRLTVTFTDDGNGVPADIQEQIFKFGFTTTRGSGLGLHHTEKILTQMGASIALNSDVKSGAQFIITF